MTAKAATLKRELGLFGASMLGLGSILGTGVFVSIGVAAGAAGPALVLAIALAALLATCNALSSAQLAAAYPVSGGAYEYGHRLLRPELGFTAGWMFLSAKTASAATAALGAAGYLLRLVRADGQGLQVPLALVLAAGFTGLVLSGLRRSSAVNVAIVSVSVAALAGLILAAAPRAWAEGGAQFSPFFSDEGGARDFFYASALMFVAYAGYARIATLGEEVVEPRRTIPRAIIVTLVVSAALYMAVAAVSIGVIGAPALAEAVAADAAPLEAVARALGLPLLPRLVAIGAVAAMLGVLLNLLLGLSRMALAMGRRAELPPVLGRLSAKGEAPAAAVIAVGAIVAGLTLLGDVETTWAFSAFTILVYYAITNLAALRLPKTQRLYPPVVARAGLAGCIFLAIWIPRGIWLPGLALIVAGLVWRLVAVRLWPAPQAQGGAA
jgi:APA family basic amino acid/polyamine antiporter